MSRDARRRPAMPDGLELSFVLVALVVGFAVLGYLMDRWLHMSPWLMVAGVFVGAALGFGYLVFILFAGSSRARRKKEPGDDSEGPDKGSS
jgi:F0F1-type ATP synthase assembly protein I